MPDDTPDQPGFVVMAEVCFAIHEGELVKRITPSSFVWPSIEKHQVSWFRPQSPVLDRWGDPFSILRERWYVGKQLLAIEGGVACNRLEWLFDAIPDKRGDRWRRLGMKAHNSSYVVFGQPDSQLSVCDLGQVICSRPLQIVNT